jgi:hypothetical protein
MADKTGLSGLIADHIFSVGGCEVLQTDVVNLSVDAGENSST